MLELLFDAPWWLPTLLIGIGAFVLYTGIQRNEKPVKRGGIAVILVGLLVILLSAAVETDREKAVHRTEKLVAAAGQQNWGAFHALIDPQTSFYGLRGPDEITEICRAGVFRVQLTSARITGKDVKVLPNVINVSIRVLSEQLGGAGVSDWQFQYQRSGGGWLLYNIRALSNDQISEENIKSAVMRR